jgi:ATP-binding cassette subfamily B multidrug efflux pump
MLGQQRRLLEQDVSKPENLGTTLNRFLQYFKRYWVGALLAVSLIIISTWAQVTAPDLIGQAVDCYIFQPQATAGMAEAMGMEDMIPADNCWYTEDDASAIEARIQADDTIPQAEKGDVITSEKLSGILGLTLLLVGLFFMSAILQGFAFYAMAWSGQNVLRDIRKELFRQIHRLSLGYFVRNEAGNVMSRITNDTDTIQQVFSNALLSVFSGFLLIGWIAVRMLQTNWVYALASLVVLPAMVFATIYFSTQARRAFRIARKEIGSVNADLQENIAGAREVQAFSREDASIDAFRDTNAANRDANIRAAAFTSALNPVLEALGVVALTIVVVVGGISILRNEPLLGIGGVVSLGTVIAFIQYIQRFNQPIQQIALLWTNIQNAIAGGERIFSLLDEDADIQEKSNATQCQLYKGVSTITTSGQNIKKVSLSSRIFLSMWNLGKWSPS